MEKNNTQIGYRPDIDGLRGFSILLVIIFHAFPELLPGGFLGVDIFFVISGYLITRILLKIFESKSSILEFYAHRIKRLFPALIICFFSVSTFAYFSLFANELKTVGKHLIASGAFFLNFTLYRENSYFDIASELKPLMHLWPLSVEEQFYVFYPIVLLLCIKLKLRIPIVLFLIGCTSFFVSVVDSNSVRNFFGLHSRMWELIIGGLLANNTSTRFFYCRKISALPICQVILNIPKWKVRANDLISIIGASSILLSILIITKDVKWNLWLILICNLGTLLIIAAGPDALVNKFCLSLKPIIFIGLISYPLYLFHWPILSFLRIIEAESTTPSTRIIALLISFTLAFLTWRFIEQPIRARKRIGVDVTILVGFVVCFILFGFLIKKYEGFPERTLQTTYENTQADTSHKKFFDYIKNNYYECEPKYLLEISESHLDLKRCAQSKPETNQDIVIIGDSHGEHLFIGLADGLRELNVVYYTFRCLPFIDIMGHPQCQDMQNALKTILASNNIKIVVIASSWPGKLRPEAGFRLSGKDLILEPDRLLKEGLSTTVGALVASKKKILVVGDNPSYGFYPAACIKSRPFGSVKQPQCAQSKERYVAEHKTSWNGIESVVSQHSNTAFLNIESLFCNEISCSMRLGEIFLYRDRHHLSVEGSWLAGGEVARKLKSLGWVN